MGITAWLLTGLASLGATVLVVPNELWKRWSGRLVDRIDQGVRRGVSRFDRRYREFVLNNLRHVDLKGLATVGYHTPELDEVYVDVSLAYRAPHLIPPDLIGQVPPDDSGRQSIGEFLDRDEPVVLAVIGGPGSGKTTMLRHTARTICRRGANHRRTVPIVLYLRDHVTQIVTTPSVSLPELVRGTLGRYAQEEPPGWFEQRLGDGDCVVLLDGLDEVPGQEDRRQVADWVERLTAQYPGNDYVITSRPQGYRAASVSGATVLQVRSFTQDQVTAFVRGWYRAVEKHSQGGATDSDEAADDLLRRLDRTPGLSALTVNPLLVTMIANVHRYRGALPGSRADLYSEICQVMLWRRQEAKKLPSELAGDKKELLLRGLAFAMMCGKVRDLPRDEVLAEFRSVLRRMSTTLDEDRFLAEVCAYGLVIERESGLYAFAHLTFQESLAANHIRGKNLVGLLTAAVDDPWWRETTLLYAAQSDADPIVEACLDSGTVTALSLAFDCAEQSGDLAPELRRRLDALLDADHPDPERQRLRVAVQVSRHLGDQIRTADGGRVCARPVDSGVYRLFLDATGAGVPDGPPAGRDEPVAGVRASDAEAFLRWTNHVTGADPGYRLPTERELDDPGVQRMLSSTPHLHPWCRAGDEMALWRPAGSPPPNVLDAETVGEHVEADLERLAPLVARLLVIRSVHAIRAEPSGRGPRLRARLALARQVADAAATRVDEDGRALARALGLDAEIDRDLTEVVRALGPGGGLDGVGDGLPEVEVTARALAQALDGAFHGLHAERWLAEFRAEFTRVTRRVDYVGTVSLDALAHCVHIGRDAIVAGAPTPWTEQVANELACNALPVFERRSRVTPGVATAVRLAALCLAAEADVHCRARVSDAFRDVATGITLLERRATGRTPATETIVPATA